MADNFLFEQDGGWGVVVIVCDVGNSNCVLDMLIILINTGVADNIFVEDTWFGAQITCLLVILFVFITTIFPYL